MADTPSTVILIRQSVIESWAMDVVSFGGLMLVMWFNAAFCGGSGWIYAITAIAWFLWLIGKASKYRREMTPVEARAWLDEKFPPEEVA